MIYLPSTTRIDEHIYIGGSTSPSKADAYGIQAIVNVAQDLNYDPPEGIDYRHIPLSDDENNPCDLMMEAADALAGFVQQGKKTLVHCHAGRSRSPSVVALYYNQYQGWPIQAALEKIKDKRPIVDPNMGIWQTAVLASRNVRGDTGLKP